MVKEKYSITILRYFIDRDSDKIDYHDTIDNIQLDSINGKKTFISYRKGHPNGTRYVVAMDSWNREYPDLPPDTETVYGYKNEQIAVDTSILNKARYYEEVYKEVHKLRAQYTKIYRDCMIYPDPEEETFTFTFFDLPPVQEKPKSDECLKIVEDAVLTYNNKLKQIARKYNLNKGLPSNLFDFLDRYIIK